jgi:hypothetical protein
MPGAEEGNMPTAKEEVHRLVRLLPDEVDIADGYTLSMGEVWKRVRPWRR